MGQDIDGTEAEKAIRKAGLEGRFRTLSSTVSTSQLETLLEDNRNEAFTLGVLYPYVW